MDKIYLIKTKDNQIKKLQIRSLYEGEQIIAWELNTKNFPLQDEEHPMFSKNFDTTQIKSILVYKDNIFTFIPFKLI